MLLENNLKGELLNITSGLPQETGIEERITELERIDGISKKEVTKK